MKTPSIQIMFPLSLIQAFGNGELTSNIIYVLGEVSDLELFKHTYRSDNSVYPSWVNDWKSTYNDLSVLIRFVKQGKFDSNQDKFTYDEWIKWRNKSLHQLRVLANIMLHHRLAMKEWNKTGK